MRLLILLLLPFLAGCGKENKEPQPPQEGIYVLCTTAQIADIVRQVGGDYIQTDTLITGQLDPHSYELVKGDDEKLAQADLIFYNGLGLEHGPSLKQYLHSSCKAAGLGDLIHRQSPQEILCEDGQIDPHYWMDISLWEKNVPLIVLSLSQKDPLHASYFEEHGVHLQEKMQKAHQEVLALMHTVAPEKRYLVTSHDAFNYFTRAYLATPEEILHHTWKKRCSAPEGLAPEGQISVKDIRSLLEHLKCYSIHTLFPESNVCKDALKKIENAGLQEGVKIHIVREALYGDAMGPASTPEGSYLGMMLYNAQVIAKHLGESGDR